MHWLQKSTNNGLLFRGLFIVFIVHAATGNISMSAWKKQNESSKEISIHQISTSQSFKNRSKTLLNKRTRTPSRMTPLNRLRANRKRAHQTHKQKQYRRNYCSFNIEGRLQKTSQKLYTAAELLVL